MNEYSFLMAPSDAMFTLSTNLCCSTCTGLWDSEGHICNFKEPKIKMKAF